MPARKRKKRRPPERRRRQRVPTQNRLPPADSFNLKARSASTWPFLLVCCGGAGILPVGPTGISPVVVDARKRRPPRATAERFAKRLVIPRRLGRGISQLVISHTSSLRCYLRRDPSPSSRLKMTERNDFGKSPFFLNTATLSFPPPTAKIALWKLLDDRFRLRN